MWCHRHEEEDLKAYLRANQRFHFALYSGSGNPEMLDMIELLWMRYGPLMNIVRSGVLSETGGSHHSAIIQAVRSEDPAAARDALCADLTDAAIPIRSAIQRKQTK
ncbi:FCD domain-containing protein [Donghicola eburneus]|uniref:FCD domain-containing protein n=1 Tax=Donghicola TaxID=393277 RepID=UPI0009F9FD10